MGKKFSTSVLNLSGSPWAGWEQPRLLVSSWVCAAAFWLLTEQLRCQDAVMEYGLTPILGLAIWEGEP